MVTRSARNQLICLWCGPVALALFGLGYWVLAGLLPPPSPSDTLTQVVSLYSHNSTGLRLGLLVVCLAGALLGPWVAAITVQLKRIEGEESPLAYTNLGLGMLTLIVFVLPMMVMETAAFRPERNPVVLQALNDLGWLSFIGIFSYPTVQCFAIALCVLSHPETALPRWFGYFNAWVGTGFGLAAPIYFVKHGPFAWDGLIPFWIPVGIFAIWMITNTWVVRTAIINAGANGRTHTVDTIVPTTA